MEYLSAYEDHVNMERIEKRLQSCEGWKSAKNTAHYNEILSKISQLEFSNPRQRDDSYSGILFDTDNENEIESLAKELIPWRKGPFKLGELEIDAEWRSDKKWLRLRDYLPDLRDKTILDIGANNGYYMFQMARHHPKLVLGIDPVIHCKAQFEFVNHFVRSEALKFELLGVEDVSSFLSMFDVIFSMGILYHHRHPLEQLIDIREALKSEGTAIIETIGIPGEQSYCLFPEDKYSKMRNVWFLPTLPCLENWLKRTGFIDIEVISVSQTGIDEQRLTKWCPPPHQSLNDFLKKEDHNLTVEGYPAPMRFCLKAKKKISPKKTFKK